MKKELYMLTALAWIITGTACSPRRTDVGSIIRAGHFPDIDHSQAMVGKVKGMFQEMLGPGVTIEWKLFNAGSSAIEAMFADELDITYIGPNPAINDFRWPV